MKRIILALAAGLTACASVQVVPSNEAAVTTEPFVKKIGFGQISVPIGTVLIPAIVDGRQSYCSTARLYSTLGDNRSVCFFDTTGTGTFDQCYVADTLKSFPCPVHVQYVRVSANSRLAGGTEPTAPSSTQNETLKRVEAAQNQQRLWEADFAECRFQAAAATAADKNVIWPIFSGANVIELCMEAKAARRRAGF